jgi:hypothetical protein
MARTGCCSAVYSLEHSVHKKPTYTDSYMQLITNIQKSSVITIFVVCCKLSEASKLQHITFTLRVNGYLFKAITRLCRVTEENPKRSKVP